MGAMPTQRSATCGAATAIDVVMVVRPRIGAVAGIGFERWTRARGAHRAKCGTLPVVLPPTRPDAATLARLLPPEVDLTVGRGLRHPDAGAVWLGVVWGRLGRGDLAWSSWDAVTAPALRPWIAAERGRLLRELGAHAAAEAWEAPALAAARDPIDAAMLRLSLAANAIGRGEVAVAGRWFDAARGGLEAAPPGPRRDRQRLRAAWVAVELTLCRAPSGARDPHEAGRSRSRALHQATVAAALPRWDAAAGRPVWPHLYAAGSDFHRAKGALFAGVLSGDTRLLAAAAGAAPPALLWAVHRARADLDPLATDAAGAAVQARALVVPPPPLAGPG